MFGFFSFLQQLFRRYYVYFSYMLIGLFFVLLLFNTITYFYIVYPRNFGWVITLRSVFTTTIGLALLTIIITAYFKAMLINPGNPRDAYPDVYEDPALLGGTFCVKCNYYKPPNAHHCSMCKVCIMDMDHHCPWLNTCIGANNLRYFFQFLVWATFGCLFMCVLQASEVYGVLWRDYKIAKYYTALSRFMLMFSFMSCFALVIALAIFAGFHAYLILSDNSTLDVMRGDKKRGMAASNWVRVFGRKPLEWFLPFDFTEALKLI
mmetsp:Transcript_738/g.1436  ORF Transcript_738/g.1436 Transcript_738/m.1436 type:complete len:263 (+) Transcript_738:295-1083(+)